jgi:hypothetical protein
MAERFETWRENYEGWMRGDLSSGESGGRGVIERIKRIHAGMNYGTAAHDPTHQSDAFAELESTGK